MTTIWTPEYNDENYPSVSIVNVKSLVGIPLTSGNSLLGKFPDRLSLLQHNNADPPDFFYAGSMPVISRRLRDYLTQLKCKFESFELETSQLVGDESFYFLNLLESFECFDWQSSTFVERGGFATSITKLRLTDISNKIETSVYRISKTIPVLTAVSDDSSRSIIEQGFTGFSLVKPESWENPASIA
ncbi:imm11 family protein [Novipirellula sp. SH528]|uniref:imm11 family protein n=1 Tax=Novipirellula sp. SH528 TaxID=3454466 RepID=UPI003F9FBA27